MRRVEGLIATIISNSEVAINRGKEDGVKVGMKFQILSDKGTEIIDPETKLKLGEIPKTKGNLEIVRVDDKFAVARRLVDENYGSSLQKIFEETLVNTKKSSSKGGSIEVLWAQVGDRVISEYEMELRARSKPKSG